MPMTRTPGVVMPVLGLLILVSPPIIAGCTDRTNAVVRPSAPAEADPVEVTLAPVEHRSIARFIEVMGTLFGEVETTISAKLSGRIVEIAADVGDEVLPGSTLAQIERTDYELALAERRTAVQAALAKVGLSEIPPEEFDPSRVPTVIRARAEASNAEARYERARQLFEQKPPLISAQDFADIRTQWEVAASGAEVELLTARAVLAEARTRQAEAAVAAQRLADTTVTAPGIPGSASLRYQVAERLVSLGEYVSEGRAMFRLVASDLIKFRADVPERFVGQVRSGQQVRVWVDAYGEPVEGRVARVSPRIDPQSRTFQVEVHIPNDSGRLKPGAFARGAIQTRVDDGVAFVPEAAVVTFAGVQKVFSVADGRAVEHRVRLGDRADGLVEIAGGLGASSVVIRGAAGLTDGVLVRAIDLP